MGANAKRGFNRLFLVMTLLWVLFLVVAYPLWFQFKGQEGARAQHDKDYKDCGALIADPSTAPHVKDCFDQADSRFEAKLKTFSLRDFWTYPVALWTLFVPLIILPPLFVYGLGVLAFWIRRGFHIAPS